MASSSSSSEIRAASRRIVDYLNDGEELGLEGAVETPPCSPATASVAVAVEAGDTARSAALPRFRWPRLVRLGRKGGGDKGKGKVEAVVEKGDGDDLPVAAVSTSGA